MQLSVSGPDCSASVSVHCVKLECIPVGCVAPASMVISRTSHAVFSGGMGVCLGGVCPCRCLPRGVSAQRGVQTPLDRDRHTQPQTQRQRQTPPVNRMTDRCKDVTFPHFRLRAVIKKTIKIEQIVTGKQLR